MTSAATIASHTTQGTPATRLAPAAPILPPPAFATPPTPAPIASSTSPAALPASVAALSGSVDPVVRLFPQFAQRVLASTPPDQHAAAALRIAALASELELAAQNVSKENLPPAPATVQLTEATFLIRIGMLRGSAAPAPSAADPRPRALLELSRRQSALSSGGVDLPPAARDAAKARLAGIRQRFLNSTVVADGASASATPAAFEAESGAAAAATSLMLAEPWVERNRAAVLARATELQVALRAYDNEITRALTSADFSRWVTAERAKQSLPSVSDPVVTEQWLKRRALIVTQIESAGPAVADRLRPELGSLDAAYTMLGSLLPPPTSSSLDGAAATIAASKAGPSATPPAAAPAWRARLAAEIEDYRRHAIANAFPEAGQPLREAVTRGNVAARFAPSRLGCARRRSCSSRSV